MRRIYENEITNKTPDLEIRNTIQFRRSEEVKTIFRVVNDLFARLKTSFSTISSSQLYGIAVTLPFTEFLSSIYHDKFYTTDLFSSFENAAYLLLSFHKKIAHAITLI